jgi:hypothetical protein
VVENLGKRQVRNPTRNVKKMWWKMKGKGKKKTG